MEDKKQIKKQINVGIGFITGRKNFQRVLKTYVYTWRESGLTSIENVNLNLLVAYDLKYSNTKSTDYTNVSKKVSSLVDDMLFIGKEKIEEEITYLVQQKVTTEEEARLLFATGYASKRNAIVYMAIKNKLDYLVFFDDDEYPMAVTKSRTTAIWGGQHVLTTHLENIGNADMTNGHHCGYISPIPYMKFNEKMTEDDFRIFIGAISNDIVTWDTVKTVMNNGGVTYADTKILVDEVATEVEEINGAKFISGANLCFNLSDPKRISPFYNPPGARGEDTFLSTCLHDKKVLRVPTYTFHDGFSTYHSLMEGVLPITLKYITGDTPKIYTRFLNACIGWVRYKPLLLFITQRDQYEQKIQEMRDILERSIPILNNYFGKEDFGVLLKELNKYHKNVEKHYHDFTETSRIWDKVVAFLAKKNNEI